MEGRVLRRRAVRCDSRHWYLNKHSCEVQQDSDCHNLGVGSARQGRKWHAGTLQSCVVRHMRSTAHVFPPPFVWIQGKSIGWSRCRA